MLAPNLLPPPQQHPYHLLTSRPTARPYHTEEEERWARQFAETPAWNLVRLIDDWSDMLEAQYKRLLSLRINDAAIPPGWTLVRAAAPERRAERVRMNQAHSWNGVPRMSHQTISNYLLHSYEGLRWNDFWHYIDANGYSRWVLSLDELPNYNSTSTTIHTASARPGSYHEPGPYALSKIGEFSARTFNYQANSLWSTFQALMPAILLYHKIRASWAKRKAIALAKGKPFVPLHSYLEVADAAAAAAPVPAPAPAPAAAASSKVEAPAPAAASSSNTDEQDALVEALFQQLHEYEEAKEQLDRLVRDEQRMRERNAREAKDYDTRLEQLEQERDRDVGASERELAALVARKERLTNELEAKRSALPKDTPLLLGIKRRAVQRRYQCRVCMNDVDELLMFLPCRHRVVCAACKPELMKRRVCVICNARATDIVPVFES